ncbi:hypothetical protein CRV00_07060 [Malaciobacter molluscorum]|uniref:c-type cytochrome n=1 Tax=Malaciobacter molluscorum TaxID=1032072 RepID=UPI00100AC817|nr:cytochrome c [Malaciobacter molluscorum]RXJ94326.1 hypothetical protein CRV00_07060 [Malaciobacter molluscorum]
MRLLTTLTLTSMMTLSIAAAQTTMCFKQNHKDMATIENTKLDGGLCKGSKSVEDMKKEGWQIDDIKITSKENANNYIYIFKKADPKKEVIVQKVTPVIQPTTPTTKQVVVSNIDEAALEEKILQRLEQRKKEEIALKKKQIYFRKSKSGEKLYKNKCQSCHGEKGEIKSKGFSREINKLNLQDFTISIRDYNNGTYDRGAAFIMRPYATLMTDQDIKNVYVYLRSINQKKKKEETKK